MSLYAHRTWAGAALIALATILVAVYGGGWETMGAALVGGGLLLSTSAPGSRT